MTPCGLHIKLVYLGNAFWRPYSEPLNSNPHLQVQIFSSQDDHPQRNQGRSPYRQCGCTGVSGREGLGTEESNMLDTVTDRESKSLLTLWGCIFTFFIGVYDFCHKWTSREIGCQGQSGWNDCSNTRIGSSPDEERGLWPGIVDSHATLHFCKAWSRWYEFS